MSGRETEPTFFVGNHPTTGEMYLPVVKFLLQHPNTALVAGRIWSLLPLLDVIPVDLAKQKHESSLKHRIEQVVLNLVGYRIPQVNVLEEIVSRISAKKDVLIFPAGGPPKDGIERRWRIGIGESLLHTHTMNPLVRFIHLHSGKVDISPPVQASTFLHGSADEVTASLRSAFNASFCLGERE